MRLGGPVHATQSPDAWIAALQQAGYRAAACPIDASADTTTRRAYREAAQHADIVIAEVGAWHNNPLSQDEAVRKAAIEKSQQQLALADEMGARCCVNIAGSRGEQWDGPHPDNLSAATFDLIVETVRAIIDGVKPTRTFYTLETMPWVFPDSVESYLALLQAIDRPQMAVHLDPVNMISSVRLYYNTTALINACFDTLGPYIKNCHAKDIKLNPYLTLHLQETPPGTGNLDYATYLRRLNQLDDIPLLLEHLPMEEYPLAADYLRGVAGELGIEM